MRDRLATVWVAPLTFVVHALALQPSLVGVWVDDAIYLGMAESLARHGTLAVSLLPGAPEVAKYPLGWPLMLAALHRLGVDLHSADGLRWILLLNVLFWALAAQVVVDGLLPRLGARPAERGAVGLLLAINTVTPKLVTTAMSEPLFTLALVSSLLLGFRAVHHPSGPRLGALAAAVALLGLTRSVGSPLALVGAGVALAARPRRVALAVLAGWAIQLLATKLQRASVAVPPEETLRVLHYFVSYNEHTAFYTRLIAAGEFTACFDRIVAVAAHNLHIGPRALAAYWLPTDFVAPGEARGPLGWVGLSTFLLAVAAGIRTPAARALSVVLVAYAAIFVLWTWPFSARFWLPVFPLLATGLVLALARGGNIGRLLMWPVVILVLCGNSIQPYYRLRSQLMAELAPASAEEAELDEGTAWLRARVSGADTLVGDHLSVWLARRLGTHAMELAALLPSDDHLGLNFDLVDLLADRTRLGAWLAESLQVLARMGDGEIWIVLLPRSNADLVPLLKDLAAAGQLRFDGTRGELAVWRVPSTPVEGSVPAAP